MAEPTILAVGAAGKHARLATQALAARGARVRGLVRKAEEVDVARAAGANEVVVGDIADRASVARALAGVRSVFYIAPAFFPGEAEVGRQMVEEALAAGVRRIVFSSVIHPVISLLPNHAAKAPVEEAILAAGLEFTFQHPTVYFQNYAQSWQRTIETGVLAEPWSAKTRFSRVDYRDVAEVAAIALTEDRLLYGTFELCAEGWLNRHEVSALVSRILGRTIKAGTIDPATLGEAAAPIRTMFEHYNHHELLGNALTLRAILGREPRSLGAYFEELAAGKDKP